MDKECDNVKDGLDLWKSMDYKKRLPCYANIFGEKISARVWAVLIHGPRHIGRYEYKGYIVATGWFGLNRENGYFETMIFSEKDKDIHFLKQRYYTLEEAKEGHQNALEFVHNRYVYLELRPDERNSLNLGR